jgi:hypothetical protein
VVIGPSYVSLLYDGRLLYRRKLAEPYDRPRACPHQTHPHFPHATTRLHALCRRRHHLDLCPRLPASDCRCRRLPRSKGEGFFTVSARELNPSHTTGFGIVRLCWVHQLRRSIRGNLFQTTRYSFSQGSVHTFFTLCFESKHTTGCHLKEWSVRVR